MEDFFLLLPGAVGLSIGWRQSFFFLFLSRSYGLRLVKGEGQDILSFCHVLGWRPLSIPNLLELLGRTSACPFSWFIVDRFRLDPARSRPHLVEENFKHVLMM